MLIPFLKQNKIALYFHALACSTHLNSCQLSNLFKSTVRQVVHRLTLCWRAAALACCDFRARNNEGLSCLRVGFFSVH